MIQEFVDAFMAKKDELREMFEAKHADSYDDIVKNVITILKDIKTKGRYYPPDPKRIHIIDDGDYQGALLYIIASNDYQPSDYWAVYVDYGSCSGCDTLQAIQSTSEWDRKPNEEQVKDYMTLALHIVQGLKEI